MRELKGKRPVGKDIPARIIISGDAGVGKTWFSLDFPNCYYIDIEGSAERRHYSEKLAAGGGAYFGRDDGSHDFETVLNEIITLATVDHEYKTVVIDSFTELYNTAAAIAELRVGNDWGKDKREANKPTRQLLRWLSKLNLTVLMICHQADEWGKDSNGDQSVIDTTYDGYKKLKFNLDLWIEMQLQGNTRRGRVRKSRLPGFPIGETFDLNYSEFADRYGVDLINAKRETIHQTAGTEAGKQLMDLCRDAGVPNEQIDRWTNKAGVETVDLLSPEVMKLCVEYCEGRINA